MPGALELELRLLRRVEEDVRPVHEGGGAGAGVATALLARLDADAALAARARNRRGAAGAQDLDPRMDRSYSRLLPHASSALRTRRCGDPRTVGGRSSLSSRRHAQSAALSTRSPPDRGGNVVSIRTSCAMDSAAAAIVLTGHPRVREHVWNWSLSPCSSGACRLVGRDPRHRSRRVARTSRQGRRSAGDASIPRMPVSRR